MAIALLLAFLPIRLGPDFGIEAHGAAQPTEQSAGLVVVTAGEHGEYSRVVFAVGADLPYRIEPEPAGLSVVFPGAPVEFEYDAVYPARRAHRVIMAEPGSGAVGASFRLRFGCDCNARTFTLDDKLVVDIYDAAPSGDHRSPAGSAAPADRPDASPASLPLAPAAADPAAPQDLADARDQAQPRPAFLERMDALSRSAPGLAPDGAAFDPDHLERMLEWAIEQGHLTGVADSSRGAPGEDGPANSQAPANGLASPQPPWASTGQSSPVADEQTVEPSLAKEEEAAALAASEPCPDAFALDMPALVGTGTFATELARRQDALSRALASDRGIDEAQHALAGFYLARLMPQEALQFLSTANRDGSTPTQRWLEAMAMALADRPPTPAARELQASSCPGIDIQLWHLVLHAAEGGAPRPALETDAILLRLSAYPAELRVELALRLAEAGIHAKNSEAVARLLDMVEQATPTDRTRARLLFLRGRLAAARGDFAGARASWREALDLPGEGGLRATLALLSSEIEHDVLDEARALVALERLAYDWRGHPAQLGIARLTAAIHERQGRVALALDAIEEVALGAEGLPDGRAAARLATDLMRRIYAEAPSPLPVDQLAAFWRYEGFVPPGSEGMDVRLAFARALIAHGLPNAAIRFLEPLAEIAGRTADDELIELLAEAHLAANQPASVLNLLRAAAEGASVSRPGRNLLAARALAALGRFAEAAGVLHGGAGDETAALQADFLWKAGLWQQASAAYRQLFQGSHQDEADPEGALRLAAAAYMAGEPEPNTRSPGAAEGSGIDSGSGLRAFASLPPRRRAASRAVAAQLLDQAASLEGLAERYRVGSMQDP